jgi:hypothetical protein
MQQSIMKKRTAIKDRNLPIRPVMKKYPCLNAAALALALVLCHGLLRADVLLSTPNTWGKYDYNEYLYGVGQGNCFLTGQSASGFTANINSNFTDVVNNGTGAIGPDGSGEGPQGRPTIYYEMPEVDLSQNGQKLTCTYNIKFNNELKNSDQFIRFGFINTNNNNSIYIKMDSLQAGGTTCGCRNDGTTTDTTGIGLYDYTSNSYPAGNLSNPNITNLNQPILGPNNGFISGNYSHCFSSGGSAGTGGSFSGGDLGAYPNGVGLGVPATLGTVHYIKFSIQRRIANGLNGLKDQFAWTNDAGSQIVKSGEHNPPYFNDSTLSLPAFGMMDHVGAIAWNIMANDMFLPAGSTNFGSYTVSNVRLIYEWLKITSVTYNPGADSLTLVWASTPYNIDTAVRDLSAMYSIEATTSLSDPITWTPLAGNIATQGDFTTNTIASVSSSPAKFFRVFKQAP